MGLGFEFGPQRISHRVSVVRDKNISNLQVAIFVISRFARVNKYHSGTSEQTKIMGTRVAYCVDMDKSVIIGNFEKRGWVAGWTIYLLHLAHQI